MLSKGIVRKDVWVRIPPAAPLRNRLAVANALLIVYFRGRDLGGQWLGCHQFATKRQVHEVNLARIGA